MKLLASGFPEFSSDFEETMSFYGYVVNSELERLQKSLDSSCEEYPVLAKAMNYSVNAGGKRIRPILTMEFCRVCGGNIQDSLSAAVAIELIHTFSLIHDDLPCMDDDEMRRGKPSCHIAFGEANALLAGDGLMAYAPQIIADSGIAPEKAVKMISALCDCTIGMIGGQIIDVGNGLYGIEQLYSMYRLKTSMLLTAASVMGCIAAGASPEQISAAKSYAHSVGIAFQLIDDVLDVTSTSEELGKPVGSDAGHNKTTAVSLIGIDKTKQEAQRLTDVAISALSEFDNNTFLLKLTDKLLKRSK